MLYFCHDSQYYAEITMQPDLNSSVMGGVHDTPKDGAALVHIVTSW